MHDAIINGYIIVVGSGVGLIGMALSERSTVRRNSNLAKTIAQTVDYAIPWLTIGGLVLFVYLNPLVSF
ncbi:hypothetical protein [Geomicrobium sp. JCM 19037]|uniref:hypothetical protein n=1 Tax=Geomicrobium sp. JCM 19037 TaxID=1460634 RepID=UPI0005A6B700|nr:hypothetical protein [Geomicrobium sp. JCM 19037]